MSVCIKDISVLIIKVRLSDVSGRLPLSLLALRRILSLLVLTLRLCFWYLYGYFFQVLLRSSRSGFSFGSDEHQRKQNALLFWSGKKSAVPLGMLWRKALPFNKALLSATFPQGATVAGRKTIGYAVLYREVVLSFVEGNGWFIIFCSVFYLFYVGKKECCFFGYALAKSSAFQ